MINNFIKYYLLTLLIIFSSCERTKDFTNKDIKDIYKVILKKLEINNDRIYISKKFMPCLTYNIPDIKILRELIDRPLSGINVTEKDVELALKNRLEILKCNNNTKFYIENTKNVTFINTSSFFETGGKLSYFNGLPFRSFYRLSAPYIYSKNGIVCVGYNLHGDRSAGGFFILSKKEGTWKVLSIGDMWVS